MLLNLVTQLSNTRDFTTSLIFVDAVLKSWTVSIKQFWKNLSWPEKKGFFYVRCLKKKTWKHGTWDAVEACKTEKKPQKQIRILVLFWKLHDFEEELVGPGSLLLGLYKTIKCSSGNSK